VRVNLILFEPDEIDHPFSPEDPRIRHLKGILGREQGQEFDAGLINGPRGKGWIEAETTEEVIVGFRPLEVPPSLPPLHLAVGACRPQTVRKVLLQATTLGVRSVHFFASSRSEQGYLESRVYRPDQVRPYLIEGAQQAFCTRLPDTAVHESFEECLEALSETRGIALDNYEAQGPLHTYPFDGKESSSVPPLSLWIGSERGWSAPEREAFRFGNIALRGLGPRVLRTETAVVAGITLCLAGMGWWNQLSSESLTSSGGVIPQ